MSYDNCLRVERAANGFSVTLKDPAILKANQARDYSSKGPYAPYRDPERCYVFTTVAQVTDFLTKNLEKALPAQAAEDTFESTFDKAAKAVTDKKD